MSGETDAKSLLPIPRQGTIQRLLNAQYALLGSAQNMATEFTLFPHLITELRLEIWRHALPAPLRRPLYPYKGGCWVIEERGLDPDPNGESLHLEFKSSLLDPLCIDLPLYFVNREARDIALKYVREQNLAMLRDSTQSRYKFLRHFNPRTDTMFVPTVDIDAFFMEHANCVTDPELEGRYFSTAHPVLPRLAITAPGLEILKRELDSFVDTCGPIDSLYVVSRAYGSTYTLQELQCNNEYYPLDLEDTPRARLTWQSDPRRWEVTGDETVLVQMKRLVAGLDDPASSTSKFDLEIQLVHFNMRG